MPEMKPQLTPKFWIIRDPDGKCYVCAAKFDYVTADDVKKDLLRGWVVEVELTLELAPERMELYKSLAALDHALGARMSPHLRDMLGELVLHAYEAGCREGSLKERFGNRKPFAAI